MISRLLTNLKKEYGIENMPFTQELCALAKKDKPYAGLNILHNMPLCKNVLFKIEPLMLGGAQLVVTNPLFFTPDTETIQLLHQANMSVELDYDKIPNDFDYVLDAAGYFKERITPRCGAVEVTKSGEAIYNDPTLTYPVINVDSSQIKSLETCLGTGDGLVRTLTHFYKRDFHQQNFVLFGFGKVGYGIAKKLKPYTKKLLIVDSNEQVCLYAKTLGYDAIHAKSKSEIYHHLKNAYGIITATGIPQIITKEYDTHYFSDKVLINMGVYDEFGDAFSEQDVLNNKKAANFALEKPTELKYIDPTFYAHNFSINLLRTRHFKPGLHPFPKDIDDNVLQRWQGIFNEKI